MPVFTQAAAVSNGRMRLHFDLFTRDLSIADADRTIDDRVRDHHTLKPIAPGFPVRTQKDGVLSMFLPWGWELTETGEDDRELIFDLHFTGQVIGEEGRWQTYFLESQKTYKSLQSNNQPVFEKADHLAIGRQIEGAKPDTGAANSMFGPVLGTQVVMGELSSPPAGKTVSVSLGLVAPTIRDKKIAKTSGNNNVGATDDKAVRMRIAERSPFGTPGAPFVTRQRKRTGDMVISHSGTPDTPSWRAGDAYKCESTVPVPAGMQVRPRTPTGGYLYT